MVIFLPISNCFKILSKRLKINLYCTSKLLKRKLVIFVNRRVLQTLIKNVMVVTTSKLSQVFLKHMVCVRQEYLCFNPYTGAELMGRLIMIYNLSQKYLKPDTQEVKTLVYDTDDN
mgnify:CR=1 FL=1